MGSIRTLWDQLRGVDTRGTTTAVTDTGPRIPTNSLGEELPGWGVSLSFDPMADRITVRWWREDTLRRRGQMKETHFGPYDLEDALCAYRIAVRTYAARRLF